MRTCVASMIFVLAAQLVACVGSDEESEIASLGAPLTGGGSLFAARDALAYQRAEARTYDYLYGAQAKFLDGVDGVSTRRVLIDDLGMAHTRLQQTVDNIPVFGGEAVVHLDANGAFRFITDQLVRGIEVDTTPVRSDFEAIDLAIGAHGGWKRVTGVPAAELYVLRRDGVDHLAYRVQIDQFLPGEMPSRPVVFVDAHTGDELMWYDNLQTARRRKSYDAQSGTRLPGTLRRNEGQGMYGDEQVDDVYEHMGNVYDYYSLNYNRDSYDDNGAQMVATVHYQQNYVNAYWNGSQTVFGDGDNIYAGPLTADDVVYHEWTHAVTENTAGLIYLNESGALNEATSDIMAAAIESWVGGNAPWWIGEDCWTPGTANDALRYMDHPANDGSSRDHYCGRYTGTEDNGGVHWNSGIGNLFFYLLSNGGSHPDPGRSRGTVTGIGVQAAADIWYRALSVYMASTTNYAGARAATESACADLHGAGSANCTAVSAAWEEVGVGIDCGGSGGGEASCEGHCDGSSPDGSCFCDPWCTVLGDCCSDAYICF